MNKLQETEAMLQKQCDNIKHIRKVFCSPDGVHLRNQMLINHITLFGDFLSLYSYDTVISACSYSIDAANMTVTVRGPDTQWRVEYDRLADIVNEMGYGTEVKFVHSEIKVLNGVTFKISDYLSADLPEEEISTLRILGKIESKMTEPRIEHTMLCEMH